MSPSLYMAIEDQWNLGRHTQHATQRLYCNHGDILSGGMTSMVRKRGGDVRAASKVSGMVSGMVSSIFPRYAGARLTANRLVNRLINNEPG